MSACLSPACSGVITNDLPVGRAIDTKVGACTLCGLHYQRTTLGVWAVMGPVSVAFTEQPSVICSAVFAQPDGLVTLMSTHRRPRIVRAADLVGITPV